MPRLTAEQREMKQRAKLPAFVPMLHETLDTPAWRAMSHGARSLYCALKRFYNRNTHNNGRLFLSHRDAAKQLGSGFSEIARWFRELQHYGFIRMMKGGGLGVSGHGVAPHWRLTEIGYMKDLPTKEYLWWDGAKFKDRKSKARSGNHGRTIPENPSTFVPESKNGSDPTRSRNPEHTRGCNRSGNPEHNIITTPIASASPPGSASSLPAIASQARLSSTRPHRRIPIPCAVSSAASAQDDDLSIPDYLRRSHS